MCKKNIIILIVLSILLFIFGYDHKIIIDSYSPLIFDPFNSFVHFFYGWDNIFDLGISNLWNYAYIFPFSFLYFLFSLLFKIQIVQALIFSLLLSIGFISFILFIQNEFQNRSFSTYIGAVFYIFNMYVILNLSGALILLLNYLILPLQLYVINRLILSKQTVKHSFILAVTIAFMSGVNPALVGINAIIIIFYLLHLYANNSAEINLNIKQTIFKIIFAGMICLSINNYWIIGIYNHFKTMTKTDVVSVSDETPEMHNRRSTYLNVFKTLGIWSFGDGVGGVYYHPYAKMYLENTYFQISLFFIPLITFFFIFRYKDKVKKYNILLFLMILGILMTVASREGFFKDYYMDLYNSFPPFTIFRASYKMISIYIFALSFFLTFGIINIKNEKIRRIISIIIVMIIITNAFPFFNKQIFFPERKIANIPEYYNDAKKYFENDNSIYKILLLPNQYQSMYEWGGIASNVEYIWNKPIFVRTPNLGITPKNTIYETIYNNLLNKDYLKANEELRIINAKYIVQRNDFDWNYYKDISHSPETISEALSGYDKVATFGKLDIYKISDKYFSPVFPTVNNIYEKINPTKYRLFIKNVRSSLPLIFLESFHKSWSLYLKKNPAYSWCQKLDYFKEKNITECNHKQIFFEGEELEYLWQKPVFDNTHKEVYNYANSWSIDSEYVKKNFPKDYYIQNPDGSIDIELVLYFKPQSYFYVGLVVSGVTFIFCISYLCLSFLRRKVSYKRN